MDENELGKGQPTHQLHKGKKKNSIASGCMFKLCLKIELFGHNHHVWRVRKLSGLNHRTNARYSNVFGCILIHLRTTHTSEKLYIFLQCSDVYVFVNRMIYRQNQSGC